MHTLTWRNIADDLAARIESGELRPGTRIEPEEQLALRLGVSRHTANRAMHELQQQGLVVRQRRWGTVVADTTQSKKRRVAYLVDVASARFQTDIMMHIEHALEEGTRLVVSTSKNDPEREAENLRRLQEEVDGIICYPADGDANAEAFNRLAESGFPLVLVDRAPRGCEHLVVLTDNARASEQAVRHLIGRGHRRIAFFGSNNELAQSVRERYLGYRSAVQDLGFATDPYERWVPVNLEGGFETTFQVVSDAFVAMRASEEPPTAAFCVQDLLAIGLLEACRTRSIVVGTDFDIATYNDYGPMLMPQHRRVNRLVQQVNEISTAAVQRLNTLMRGGRVNPGPVRIPLQFVPAEEPQSLLASSSLATSNDAAPPKPRNSRR